MLAASEEGSILMIALARGKRTASLEGALSTPRITFTPVGMTGGGRRTTGTRMEGAGRLRDGGTRSLLADGAPPDSLLEDIKLDWRGEEHT